MEFRHHAEEDGWKSEGTVHLLGCDLGVLLADETGDEFESQQRLLTFALKSIPSQEAECRLQMLSYYREACEDFPDLVGSELLPVIEDPSSLGEVYGFSMLEIPQQMEGRGITFVIWGGCTWDEEHGIQLFFRDGVLERIDSGAALWY
jgi:hypothetical protein